MRESIF